MEDGEQDGRVIVVEVRVDLTVGFLDHTAVGKRADRVGDRTPFCPLTGH